MQATIVKRQLTLFVIAHVLYGVHDNLRCLGNCLMQALPYAGTALCRHIHLNLMQALPLTGIMMHTQHTHFFDSNIQSSLSSLIQPEPLQHPPLAGKILAIRQQDSIWSQQTVPHPNLSICWQHIWDRTHPSASICECSSSSYATCPILPWTMSPQKLMSKRGLGRFRHHTNLHTRSLPTRPQGASPGSAGGCPLEILL